MAEVMVMCWMLTLVGPHAVADRPIALILLIVAVSYTHLTLPTN